MSTLDCALGWAAGVVGALQSYVAPRYRRPVGVSILVACVIEAAFGGIVYCWVQL